ncbi:MAG: hypothetical protein Q4B16_08970, partial [Bacteroidia bacterium]|nr:hypothetical protein [Bacteroidia bacterium]
VGHDGKQVGHDAGGARSCTALPEGFGTAAGWASLGLSGYDPSRPVTRLEAAVLLDSILDPFSRPIDFSGRLL